MGGLTGGMPIDAALIVGHDPAEGLGAKVGAGRGRGRGRGVGAEVGAGSGTKLFGRSSTGVLRRLRRLGDLRRLTPLLRRRRLRLLLRLRLDLPRRRPFALIIGFSLSAATSVSNCI